MAGVAISGDAPCRYLHRSGPLLLGALPLLVTADAVVHRERLEGAGGRPIEGFHRPMTRLARALRHHHVGPMREEDVGRQAPDTLPRDLLALLAEGPDLFHFFALGLSSSVAGETER